MKKQLFVALLALSPMAISSGNISTETEEVRLTKKEKQELFHSQVKETIEQQLWALYEKAEIDYQSFIITKELKIDNKFDIESREKIRWICSELNINEEDLYRIIKFESGGNPKAVNPITKATGLIQFMPSTAKGLGTTVEEIYNMSTIEQLEYVYLYLKPISEKYNLDTRVRLYLAVLSPMSLSGNNIIASSTTKAYQYNSSLDINQDGYITISDISLCI